MDKLPQPAMRSQSLLSMQGLNLQDILNMIRREIWFLVAVVILMLAGSALYIFLDQPVYRSTALVQITRHDTDNTDKTHDFLLYNTAPAETDMEIIATRPVLSQVVDQLKLDIRAHPRYFPIMGEAVARYNANSRFPVHLFGAERYAWGEEQVRIQRLEVPAVYIGRPLVLVAGTAGHYRLLGPGHELLISGQVGTTARARLARDPSHPILLQVAALRAHPGTEFSVIKESKNDIISALQAKIKVIEKGADKGKQTGVLQLSLDGAQPELIAGILNAVANNFIHQAVERKQADTEKVLAFLNGQLPIVKAKLDAAETALAAYSAQKGGVDLPLTAQNTTNQLGSVDKDILATQIQLMEARQNFGDRHPLVLTIEKKLQQLQAQKAALAGQASSLPGAAQTIARLQRNVKVATDLYMMLQNKAQELNIVKAGIVSNAYLLEPASVSKLPVNMPPWVILTFSAIAGILLSSSVIVLRRLLSRGLEDPVLVEQKFDLPVYACIEHSAIQAGTALAALRMGAARLPALAISSPDDRAIEGLRRLRTHLLSALSDCPNNIVAVCSPKWGNGKTFVSVNLAYVFAFAERRVLLIDADMRRRGASAYFSDSRQIGLADVLNGTASLDAAIQQGELSHVHFLAAGNLPPNPSELLMTDRFPALLKTVADQFDLILLDTPPVLDSTDAANIAPLAGLHLLVVHAKRNKAVGVAHTIKELRRNGAGRIGIVINEVSSDPSDSPYPY